MRFVNRSSVKPPSSLVGECSKGMKEFKAAKEALEGGAKSFEFSAYSDDGVKLALEKLFHGKCAYCESYYFAQAPVDVEHFRPKGRVADEDDHKGYWWLAMAWENLLPSCIDCNRRRWQDVPKIPTSLQQLYLAPEIKAGVAKLGKQDLFPIAGTRATTAEADLLLEQALLLEPTIDDPSSHLCYYFDDHEPLGLILPRMEGDTPSAKGLMSIHVYGLNRLGLVQERTRILQRLNFLAHLIEELEDIAKQARGDRTADGKKMAARLEVLAGQVFDEIARMAAPDQPFCSLVKAWAADQGEE